MRATTIRFSEDMCQLLEREAQRQGVSAAQFLRESALPRLGAASAGGDEAPAGRADGSADVSRQLASLSFCQYVVARRESLIVSDAREHPELRKASRSAIST